MYFVAMFFSFTRFYLVYTVQTKRQYVMVQSHSAKIHMETSAEILDHGLGRKVKNTDIKCASYNLSNIKYVHYYLNSRISTGERQKGDKELLVNFPRTR